MYIVIDIINPGCKTEVVKILNVKKRVAFERHFKEFEQAIRDGVMKEVL
jgi:hypothetical protein